MSYRSWSALLCLLLCACPQPSAAPPRVQAPDPLPSTAQPQEPEPPKDPFALDEASDDPAAALEGMRHNCCDEMPEKEVREHSEGR